MLPSGEHFFPSGKLFKSTSVLEPFRVRSEISGLVFYLFYEPFFLHYPTDLPSVCRSLAAGVIPGSFPIAALKQPLFASLLSILLWPFLLFLPGVLLGLFHYLKIQLALLKERIRSYGSFGFCYRNASVYSYGVIMKFGKSIHCGSSVFPLRDQADAGMRTRRTFARCLAALAPGRSHPTYLHCLQLSA